MPAMGFPCGLEGCPKKVELRSKGQCSGCKKIHYCSREHQTRDWKRHKKDCKVTTACPNNVPDSMRNTERLREDLNLKKKRFLSGIARIP